MNIVYWDIDGTLINTGVAGMHAVLEVFRQCKGPKVHLPRIEAGGRTDNYICQQVLYKSTGIMPTEEEVQSFCRQYEAALLKWLQRTGKEGTIFKAVPPILEALHHKPQVKQLLLTGNSSIGAKLKLSYFGLDKYFDFVHSGFAFHFYYRNDLAQHARKIAEKQWGDEIAEVYVIGDTPYDIQCGKAIGAKTIAVATGHYSYDVLAACEPWAVLPELPDVDTFISLLQV
ncbi:HAD family hydrolase [Megasphaera sp. UPII 135-E]|uniref:HAD family hydrolase n=1 Tax=Megasphaera sp. UPII 135-E TaxID=1000569 RepID=UPI00021A3AD7|nr:HAD hydrolase-like protein [Megasphaera sp. UPII 135-E]EGS32662.1 haloacid dehalogenase-like hydrolase [Megasphaera sp. UPII 135-E]